MMLTGRGERTVLTWWIHRDVFAVRVRVEAVYPIDDPSEPCFEPAAIKLLDHLQDLADAGDVDALAKHGDVYVRLRRSA